jgi:hypothetical protein
MQRARVHGLPVDPDLVALVFELFEAQGARCALTGIEFDLRVVGTGKARRRTDGNRSPPTLGCMPSLAAAGQRSCALQGLWTEHIQVGALDAYCCRNLHSRETGYGDTSRP